MNWPKTTQKLDAYIEWDGQRLRVALLRGRRSPELLVAGEVTADAERWAAEATRIVRLLAGERPLARLVVTLGRAAVGVHELTVPAAPEEELPGLVRFQAIRELGLAPEKAHLDYCITPPTRDQALTALVVYTDDELWRQLTEIAEGVGAELAHVFFRPLLSARLGELASRGLVPEKTILCVHPLPDACECAVLHEGKPVLVRGVRLTGAAAHSELLHRELRRTRLAAEQRLGGVSFALVYPGPAALADELAAVAQRLAMQAFSYDPFAGIRLASEAEATVSKAPGEWAALAALLRGQATETVDLARPKLPLKRRTPVPRPVLVGGAVLAAGLVLLGAWSQWNLRGLEAQLELYRAQERQLDRFLQSAAPFTKKYHAVAAWVGNAPLREATVLEILAKLTAEFPDTSELYLQSLSLRRTEKGEITMVVEGYAKSPRAVAAFHARLNQGNVFRARPRGGVQRVPRRTDYPWHFESELTLLRDQPGTQPRDAVRTRFRRQRES